MLKINQLYLNKNKYKTEEKHPSYVAQVKDEAGNWVKVASAWVSQRDSGKVDENGKKIMEPSISVKFAEGLFLEGIPTYKPKPKVSQGEVMDIPFE